MKKIIYSVLALSLMALCIPGNVNAQSTETELDQVELMKQFIGKWEKMDSGEDTTIVWNMVPFGKGYQYEIYQKVKGETNVYGVGITKVSKNLVQIYHLWSNGNIVRDFGRFESEDKIVFERYNRAHTKVFGMTEWHLVDPDEIKMIWKRKKNDTWDEANVIEWTYTRVK